MSNMPAWMAGHIGRRDSFATVDVRRSLAMNEREADAMLTSRLTPEDLMVLYATPVVINVQCGKVIGLLREQIIKSGIDEGGSVKSSRTRMADYIKKAQDALDAEFDRLKRHGDAELSGMLQDYADSWFNEVAIGLIQTWRNAFSAILLKRRFCNDNENLHEFLCYALAARAIAREAMDCEYDITHVLTEKLKGSGLVFNLHGNSATVKMLTATNVICDRFGLPSYDDMMQDLNVRRCQDNWVRSVGSVMQLLSETMTTKKPKR